jgi:hypothetical protein
MATSFVCDRQCGVIVWQKGESATGPIFIGRQWPRAPPGPVVDGKWLADESTFVNRRVFSHGIGLVTGHEQDFQVCDFALQSFMKFITVHPASPHQSTTG